MKKEFWLVIFLGIIIIVLASAFFWLDIFIKPPVVGNDNIKVTSIKRGQEISSPLIVEGEAKGTWFFEASFPIKIEDENGMLLGSSYATAQSDWMTEEFVPFKGEITYVSKIGGKGFLVLSKDNPSGLPEHDEQIKIPVILQQTGFTTVKVFFSNNNLDPEITCDKVFPVDREIMKIDAIGTAAINQLLLGPTQQEKDEGYLTSINLGVQLKSLSIDESGTAYADFNEQLEYQVGGSCRVGIIRAQIIETLKQFPTVNSVVISIEGRTEDILQP